MPSKETAKIHQTVAKFAKDFVQGLKDTVPVKSGQLRDSIHLDITNEGEVSEFQISMNEYFEDLPNQDLYNELFDDALEDDVLDDAVGKQMDEIIIAELTKNGGKLKS